MNRERDVIRFEWAVTLAPWILTAAFSITNRGMHLTWSALDANDDVQGPPSFARREEAA